MGSVADVLSAEDRAAVLALNPDERVALALALGDRDLELFRLAHHPPLGRDEAAHLLDRQRQAGRRSSRCLEELVG